MTVSENYIDIYRSPDYITMLIQDVSDSFLTFIGPKVTSTTALLVEKLKTIDLPISTQIMHTFEAPLDKHDFKDLVKQLISVIMDDLIEKGLFTGVLKSDESEQIKNALDESMELEFCSIYNPILKF